MKGITLKYFAEKSANHDAGSKELKMRFHSQIVFEKMTITQIKCIKYKKYETFDSASHTIDKVYTPCFKSDTPYAINLMKHYPSTELILSIHSA